MKIFRSNNSKADHDEDYYCYVCSCSSIQTTKSQDYQGDFGKEQSSYLHFPELYLGAYDNYTPITQEDIKEISCLSRNVCIVLGYVEEIDGKLYNTSGIFLKGTLIGKYQKAHLWYNENNPYEKRFTPGTEAGVSFEYRGLKIGCLICYDLEVPEMQRTLFGVDLCIYISHYPLDEMIRRLGAARAIENKTNHKLRYAYSGLASGEGNCGPSDSWQSNDVDDMSAITPVGISMKLDPQGYPIIAYQYVEQDQPQAHALLRIARPYLAYDDGSFGNCGDVPPGYLYLYWRCLTLDAAGPETYAAAFVSLAIADNGLAVISYSERDDYYSITSLKLAYQRIFLYLPLVKR